MAARRLQLLSDHLAPTYWGRSDDEARRYRQLCLRLLDALRATIDAANCAPILLRLAWHDAGTFDASLRSWPRCGGANGSIRFEDELAHPANAGLHRALALLRPFKLRFAAVSWADLIQLAAAAAVECCAGPRIPLRVGRVDTTSPSQCPADGLLPAPRPPFPDGSADAPSHVRRVFRRMGFGDAETVALLGAHTIGRAFAERSGVTACAQAAGEGTPYTAASARVRADGGEGVGTPGGQSWCTRWLTFDNEYYKYLERGPQPGLLWLPTDAALHEDEAFRPHFERYARDQAAFFEDYARAHARLSELGSKFDPPEGILL
ncbi:hypothetical protein AB1Y20_006155 [Prymnesium parvum]|uniref:Plant heme peroxidase family profile domain-containing protein n=1 Tax=Prymnesium parvum TaxID=97485 RepID=A0AB34J1V2_PRYPA